MACERYRNALTDAAAGAPALAELDAHLAGCGACRHELAALRRALALADSDLGQLLAAEPSPELAARIRQAAAEPLASTAWRPGFVLQALAAVALLAAALVVIRGRAPAPRPVAAVATRAPAPTASPSVVASAPAPRVVPPETSHMRRAAPAEPEVLVPLGELEVLVHFAAQLRRRAVTPESLLVADLNAPLPEPKGVLIRALEIVPLDPEEALAAE
jgi:hypothetical protein